MSINTQDQRMVRGQTFRLRFTAKDERGQRVDITGADAYLTIRPDIKAPPMLSITAAALLSETASAVGVDSLTHAGAAMVVDVHAGRRLVDSAGDDWKIVSNTAQAFVLLANGATPAAGAFTVRPASRAVLSTQSGSTLGQYIVTIDPADTADWPVGDYVYDSWVVEATGDEFPVVATSKLTVLPETTSSRS